MKQQIVLPFQNWEEAKQAWIKSFTSKPFVDWLKDNYHATEVQPVYNSDSAVMAEKEFDESLSKHFETIEALAEAQVMAEKERESAMRIIEAIGTITLVEASKYVDLEKAMLKYATESFIVVTNQFGEKRTTPVGQNPYGWSKHLKNIKKHYLQIAQSPEVGEYWEQKRKENQ